MKKREPASRRSGPQPPIVPINASLATRFHHGRATLNREGSSIAQRRRALPPARDAAALAHEARASITWWSRHSPPVWRHRGCRCRFEPFTAAYGAATTTASLDRAGLEFTRLTGLLIRLAEDDEAVRNLQAALRKTVRRLNALEQLGRFRSWTAKREPLPPHSRRRSAMTRYAYGDSARQRQAVSCEPRGCGGSGVQIPARAAVRRPASTGRSP